MRKRQNERPPRCSQPKMSPPGRNVHDGGHWRRQWHDVTCDSSVKLFMTIFHCKLHLYTLANTNNKKKIVASHKVHGVVGALRAGQMLNECYEGGTYSYAPPRHKDENENNVVARITQTRKADEVETRGRGKSFTPEE